MFVEDVGIDPSHSLAVSEQKRAETVLIQLMNSRTDRETGLCLAVVSPDYFPMEKAKYHLVFFDIEKQRFNFYFMPTKVVKEMLKNQLVSQSFCWVGRRC